MVEKIRHLVLDFLRIRILCRDDQFGGFLSHLLQDFVDSLVEEVIGVGAFLRMYLPIRNYLIYIFKYL